MQIRAFLDKAGGWQCPELKWSRNEKTALWPAHCFCGRTPPIFWEEGLTSEEERSLPRDFLALSFLRTGTAICQFREELYHDPQQLADLAESKPSKMKLQILLVSLSRPCAIIPPEPNHFHPVLPRHLKEESGAFPALLYMHKDNNKSQDYFPGRECIAVPQPCMHKGT